MRTMIVAAIAIAVLPFGAPAQEWQRSSGQGYTFFAAGSYPDSAAALHIGGGGERFTYRGLAAGAELGYIFPAQSFRYGFGLASVNGSYHLNRGSHWKISPFVTGGYSLAFRGSTLNLVNFGGGLTYWIGDRLGLRLEVRDHLPPQYPREHSLEFRIGLAFR